jgi:alanine transaminase
VIINPGNPTGSIFSKASLETLFKFAHDKGIIVLADEVYQENIYSKKKDFISCRKVLSQMAPEIANTVELASFHSCSKGFLGECGLRGGYVELHNFQPEVVAMIHKLQTIRLCPNSIGQIAMDLKVRPPSSKDCTAETVKQYKDEVASILSDLKKKALIAEKALNSMDGMHCNAIEGAMYAFPKVSLSKQFEEEAKTFNRTPDQHYCMLGNRPFTKPCRRQEP